MRNNVVGAVAMLAATLAVACCASKQVAHNALQMAVDVASLRDEQVFRNISAAISDHDMVPAQIFLGTGQATVATGGSATFKLPHFDFSKPTKEADPAASDVWTAQWQFLSVTNADDLRRLRNLYVLI